MHRNPDYLYGGNCNIATSRGEDQFPTQFAIKLCKEGLSVDEISSRLECNRATIETILYAVTVNPKSKKDLLKLVPLGSIARSLNISEPMLKIQVYLVLKDEQSRISMFESMNEQVEAYSDPLYKDIMTDPVIAADGMTYQRICICNWATTSLVSPFDSSVTLYNGDGVLVLKDNLSLKREVAIWLEAIEVYFTEMCKVARLMTPWQLKGLYRLVQIKLRGCEDMHKKLRYIELMPSIEFIFDVVKDLLLVKRMYILKHCSLKLIFLMLEAVHLEQNLLQGIYTEVKEVVSKEKLDELIEDPAVISLKPNIGFAILKQLRILRGTYQTEKLQTTLENFEKTMTDQISGLRIGLERQLALQDQRLGQLELRVDNSVVEQNQLTESQFDRQMEDLQGGLIAIATANFNEVFTMLEAQGSSTSQISVQLNELEKRLKDVEDRRNTTHKAIGSVEQKLEELENKF